MNQSQNFKTHATLNTSVSTLRPNWQTDPTELLFDLKILMKDYYVATFTELGESLKLNFNNGQSFIISVKACE